MSNRSNIEMTGRNALIAAGISLGAVLLLTIVFLLLATAMRFANNSDPVIIETFDLWQFIVDLRPLLFVLLIFAGGPVFVVSFALLQRFRIRY